MSNQMPLCPGINSLSGANNSSLGPLCHYSMTWQTRAGLSASESLNQSCQVLNIHCSLIFSSSFILLFFHLPVFC
ncbi:hypothetical protein BDV29DRAFT_185867 [Aspergillus leporis]|uniref:Uncharacterized protein n=1 Tax=Aspergillus leporis TaxID=41062 RepID=A0A5N5WHD2_9EURO|nr:hypothetical protein BDV29DRAFT_185867 [Aspergillus leporis]